MGLAVEDVMAIRCPSCLLTSYNPVVLLAALEATFHLFFILLNRQNERARVWSVCDDLSKNWFDIGFF